MKIQKRRNEIILFFICVLMIICSVICNYKKSVKADSTYSGFYFSPGAGASTGNDYSLYSLTYTLKIPADVIDSNITVGVSILKGVEYFRTDKSMLNATNGTKSGNTYTYRIKIFGVPEAVKTEIQLKASFSKNGVTYETESESRSLYYIWSKINENNDWENSGFSEITKNTIIVLLNSFNTGFLEEAKSGTFVGEFSSLTLSNTINFDKTIFKIKKENSKAFIQITLKINTNSGVSSMAFYLRNYNDRAFELFEFGVDDTSYLGVNFLADIKYLSIDNYCYFRFDLTNLEGVLSGVEINGQSSFALAPSDESYLAEIVKEKGELERQVNLLKTEKAELSKAISLKNEKISELNTQIISLNDTINLKNKEISNKQTELLNVNSNLSILQAEYSALETNYNNKVSELSKLKTEYNNYKTSAEATNTENQNKIQAFETNINSLNADIIKLNNDIKNLNQTITEKESEKTQLYTQIELLNDEIVIRENKYNVLLNSISQDTAELVTLVAELEDKNEKLEALNKELEESIKKHEESKTGCSSNISSTGMILFIALASVVFLLKRGAKDEK